MSEKNVGFFFYQPPIFGNRKKKNSTKWTVTFISMCVIMFVLSGFIPMADNFAFTPVKILSQPWTFVTSMFLHASLDHLFFNMFALYIFGRYLESRVSEKRFLSIFFLSGILGNLAYYAMSPASYVPAVGASGAIYGIMGALAALYPGLVIYLFGIAPMPMIFAAGLWFVMEFTGMFIPSNIAHEAHLAGLLLGLAYGFYIKKDMNKTVFFWEK